MKFQKGIYNIIVGLVSQIIVMALGFVIPRFILVNYGSEVNGLFNSVSQIYSYIALLEAGVGASIIQSLYKYIDNGDKNDISSILSAGHGFYKKISLVYLIAVFFIGIGFCIGTNSEINRIYILIIFWLQGIAGVVNFRFLAAEKLLLTVEGKNYISNTIATISTIITSIGKIILVNLQINIVLLQVFYCFINIAQLIFYFFYFKKNYKWINLNAVPKKSALKQKNYYLITEIAWTVFSCSPTVILSFFCDFKVVSVYAIYNLLFTSLSTLLNTVYSGTQFILSRSYHQDKNRYIMFHDSYDCCFIMLISACMSICYLMILPFINLYTSGINDIQYIDKYLPLLFCLVQLFSWMRYVSGNLINVSGNVHRITTISIIEAVINVSLSILLVHFFDIYGVFFGMLCALLIKSNYLIIFANKFVLNRTVFKTYKTIFANFLLFAAIVFINTKIEIICNNYIEWIKNAVFVSITVFAAYFLVNLITNFKLFKFVFENIKQIITNFIKKKA